MKRALIQTRAELRLLARNGEQLLLVVVIPLLLLVFFGTVDVLPTGDLGREEFLVPGIMALAVMSTSMVSLGIATGFERSYLVFKRLGATPLRRGELVGAKIASVAVVEVVQFALIVPVALAIGWDAGRMSAAVFLAGILLGTAAFAGIGILLAGSLRAEINLAAQNGLYLVLLLLGGMVIPVDSLPGPLATVAPWLPSGALASVLRDASIGAGVDAGTLGCLAAWAVVAPLTAARRFRWW
jgi:ABC-2 type transport system permease protein